METRLKAPTDYILGEAVNGKWKERLLIYLSQLFNLKIFVESGTSEASTLLAVKDSFDKCYSIELSEKYFNKSRSKVLINKGDSDIELFMGNSAIVLPEILKRLVDKKILFWLDAHVSAPDSANEGDPLPEEIKAITELSPDSLIVIDDQKDALLCQVPSEYLKGYTVEFRYGVVFLYKTGLYNIPEFE